MIVACLAGYQKRDLLHRARIDLSRVANLNTLAEWQTYPRPSLAAALIVSSVGP